MPKTKQTKFQQVVFNFIIIVKLKAVKVGLLRNFSFHQSSSKSETPDAGPREERKMGTIGKWKGTK